LAKEHGNPPARAVATFALTGNATILGGFPLKAGLVRKMGGNGKI
jgi:hypothetical protein